jgi:hypothetical protein
MRSLLPRYADIMGFLMTPANHNCVATIDQMGLPLAADNGAFSGFDPVAFRAMLGKVKESPLLAWVACPDVVADAKTTISLYRQWEPELRLAGVPVAFVLQDGQEDEELPAADCYFIGGSTRFKLSKATRDLVWAGKERGSQVHMGRVNTRRRLEIAYTWGCDSVDGSAASRWGDRRLREFLKWLREIENRDKHHERLWA